ncbi:hypothetical protein ACWDG9_16395 [Streptomyces sp. NPDC001073]
MSGRYELHTTDCQLQILTPSDDREACEMEGLAPDNYALVLGPYSGALAIEGSADSLHSFTRRLTSEANRRLPAAATPVAEGYNEDLTLDGALRIVSEWCIESNDCGGIDAGDLAWRLEQAGYRLPGDETLNQLLKFRARC